MDNEIIKREKEYLVNVLHKTIIEEDITWPISKYTPYHTENKTTFKNLAKKYLACDFKQGRRNVVHHIDFDHSHNVLSNLVVLTHDEHQIIHNMFDPSYEEVRQKISSTMRGRKMSDEFRRKTSERMKGDNNPMKRKEVALKTTITKKINRMRDRL